MITRTNCRARSEDLPQIPGQPQGGGITGLSVSKCLLKNVICTLQVIDIAAPDCNLYMFLINQFFISILISELFNLNKQQHGRLTLEKHRFDLRGSTYFFFFPLNLFSTTMSKVESVDM